MAKTSKKKPREIIEGDVQEVQTPDSVGIEVEQIDCPDDNIEVIGKNQEFSLTMYLDKDADQRTFVTFIKKVEKHVRGNPDYKDYVEYLRDEKGLDTCAFLGNVSVDSAEIHLHHAISNLFEICSTVTNRLMSEGKKVSTFIVADEVLMLHFRGLVALTPLTATMHELVHAGKIRIPLNAIHGDWETYLEEYGPYMDDHEKKSYEKIQELPFLPSSKELKAIAYNPTGEEDDPEDEEIEEDDE